MNAEQHYSNSLIDLNNKMFFHENSTLSNALDQFRSLVGESGQRHKEFTLNILSVLLPQIKQLKSEYVEGIKQLSRNYESSKRKLQLSKDAFEKSVRKIEAINRKQKGAISKWDNLRKRKTTQSKIDKAERQLEEVSEQLASRSRCHTNFIDSVDSAQILFSNEIDEIMQKFRKLQIDRFIGTLEIVRIGLKSFKNVFNDTYPKIHDCESYVGKIDILSDMLDFIQSLETCIIRERPCISTTPKLDRDSKIKETVTKEPVTIGALLDTDRIAFVVQPAGRKNSFCEMEILSLERLIVFMDENGIFKEIKIDDLSQVSIAKDADAKRHGKVMFVENDKVFTVYLSDPSEDIRLLALELRSVDSNLLISGYNVDPGQVCFSVLRTKQPIERKRQILILCSYSNQLKWRLTGPGIDVSQILKSEESISSNTKLFLQTTESEYTVKFSSCEDRSKFTSYLWRMRHGLSFLDIDNVQISFEPLKMWVGS